MLSREDPPVYLGPLAISGRLLFIDGRQMQLTPEEGMAFLRQTLKLKESDEVLLKLNTYAEGWIGGLQLAAATGACGKYGQLLRAGGGIASEYLTREIIESLAPAEKEFLIKTGFISYFDAEICASIIDDFTRADFDRMMESLVSKNLFIICVDETGGVYRYHNILLDYLSQQFLHLPEEQRHVSVDVKGKSERVLRCGIVDVDPDYFPDAVKAVRQGVAVDEKLFRRILDAAAGVHITAERLIELTAALQIMYPVSLLLGGPGSEMAMHAGRDNGSMAKKNGAEFVMRRNGDDITVQVARRGALIVDAALKVGRYNTPLTDLLYQAPAAGKKTYGGGFYFHYDRLPDEEGVPRFVNGALTTNFCEYNYHAWEPAFVDLKLYSSPDDPWGELPINTIVGGAYSKNDLIVHKSNKLVDLDANDIVPYVLSAYYDRTMVSGSFGTLPSDNSARPVKSGFVLFCLL